MLYRTRSSFPNKWSKCYFMNKWESFSQHGHVKKVQTFIYEHTY